jgi:predicted NAD/FAD-dependent oxidoreductase
MNVVVVGAGLAGLMAGRALADTGHGVLVLDKGRSPGGRLATRRIGPGTLDHGAQFLTVRSDEFATHVHRWAERGLVKEWCRGFAVDDGHPRYVVAGGMNALARHLAVGLEVRCSTLVFALRRGVTSAWSVGLDDGTDIAADAVVLTCPLPQSFSLLVTAGVELPPDLRNTDYDRTLALLAVLDGPPAVPPPGGVQDADETFSFIGDNQAKGVSAVPAVTFHARPDWSLERWDHPRDAVHAELIDRARPWLGAATIVESQVKRWRFATPQKVWPDRCWVAPDPPGRSTSGPSTPEALVLAGDAFDGPRVEGAALSGLAAAAALGAP